jgi:RNA polymerase sigma factor for flagellar operon FliA
VEGLPADAGLLIRGIYYEGLSIQEAGRKIGISKAWASRLHAKTLEKMAKALSSDQWLKC